MSAAAAQRMALKLRATRPAAQGRGTKSVPRQGRNTPLPLERSPPASFKRLLGSGIADVGLPGPQDRQSVEKGSGPDRGGGRFIKRKNGRGPAATKGSKKGPL